MLAPGEQAISVIPFTGRKQLAIRNTRITCFAGKSSVNTRKTPKTEEKQPLRKRLHGIPRKPESGQHSRRP